MEYLRINLADEAPRLGCGHRSVLAVAVGPKWATLLEPSSGEHVDLPREDVVGAKGVRERGYDFLARRGVALPLDDPEALARRIVRNCAANGTWSGVARDACLALGLPASELPGAAEAALEQAPTGGLGEPTPAERLSDKEGVGDFVKRQWMSGVLTPEEVVERAQRAFPGCRVNRAHVAFYRSKLVSAGVANVPPMPSQR